MQALETYPPFHGTPLLGNPDQDYQHAVQYMQNLPDHRKIGTLSQSEWDATCKYKKSVMTLNEFVLNIATAMSFCSVICGIRIPKNEDNLE